MRHKQRKWRLANEKKDRGDPSPFKQNPGKFGAFILWRRLLQAVMIHVEEMIQRTRDGEGGEVACGRKYPLQFVPRNESPAVAGKAGNHVHWRLITAARP